MQNKTANTKLIKDHAKRLGFLSCGISKGGFLEEEAPRLSLGFEKNMHGKMSYMENHFDKRLDTTKLVEGSKKCNIIVTQLLSECNSKDEHSPKISKYAYGKDYHFVIKEKLKTLLEVMREEIGEINGRAFVDSAPVLDKAWAAKSGLGWVGKHSNLLTQKTGSFFTLLLSSL